MSAIQAGARAEIAHLSGDPFWTAGALLYWAEGDKTKRNLAMTNSDPALLRIFIRWVRTYLNPAAAFVLSIHLHEGCSENAAKEFWRTELGLPNADFWKTQWKHLGTGQRKNRLAHGVCRVYVRSGTDTWIRTLAWLHHLAEIGWPEDPSPVLSSSAGR